MTSTPALVREAHILVPQSKCCAEGKRFGCQDAWTFSLAQFRFQAICQSTSGSQNGLSTKRSSLQRRKRLINREGKPLWSSGRQRPVITRDASTMESAESSGQPKETDIAYRPVVILPGLGNNTGDYAQLEKDLKAHGLTAVTARVSRPDWLRNAAGLLDGAYWRGELKPRPTLDWYLERIQEAIAVAKTQSNGSQVTILAHSAGGWLARVYLSEYGTADVAALVTLGSPHLPPPRDVPGVIDQTRGLLYHVEDTCPGAYHDDVKYVCVAGRYIKGAKLFDDTRNDGAAEAVEATISDTGSAVVATASEAANTLKGGGLSEGSSGVTWNQKVVGQGYKQVCGDPEAWGDGVVPEPIAHLEGALNITLDGVYHSPVGVEEGNGNGRKARVWYGSPGILEQWVHHLFD